MSNFPSEELSIRQVFLSFRISEFRHLHVLFLICMVAFNFSLSVGALCLPVPEASENMQNLSDRSLKQAQSFGHYTGTFLLSILRLMIEALDYGTGMYSVIGSYSLNSVGNEKPAVCSQPSAQAKT